MKGHRHPHPHVDPRQPRDKTTPAVNPPVFAFKPIEDAKAFRLTISHDPGFHSIHTDIELTEPCWLSETPFEPDTYYWKWATEGIESEVFTFEMADNAALVVPSADEWLRRMPAEHPRIYTRPEAVKDLRTRICNRGSDLLNRLIGESDRLMKGPHKIDKPVYLPDQRREYENYFNVWSRIMRESRRFVQQAEHLALAYLLTGEEKYGRAACRRMVSISEWDPHGPSHIGHNDEAHMSVIWNGAKVVDWVWNLFTDAELAVVIRQFTERGRITYEHMHDCGSYGVTRFDSHAGREIVFLALIGLVFHEHIPEAKRWLTWLRPLLCGVWPVWADEDGGWSEGISYSLAYVKIMTMFCTALKTGTDVDLYKRPFWKNHAEWRRRCHMPYAEWIGFGDSSERWAETWRSGADLVDIISRQLNTAEFNTYIEAMRREAETCPSRYESEVNYVQDSQLFFLEPVNRRPGSDSNNSILKVFPGAGWAAVRTDMNTPENDVALLFRSSPFGSFSHSHANCNDFILHAGGKVLAMPSGYYDAYGSKHHVGWVWHTKANNCMTLSGAPQQQQSRDSVGRVDNAYEDDQLVYFRGVADAAYGLQADLCRRHVVFLKAYRCFVLIDEFVAKSGLAVTVEWNLHSWAPIQTHTESMSFSLERAGSRLDGIVMYHENSFFAVTEGWEPPPMKPVKRGDQWHLQYHLKFSTSSLLNSLNLGVILLPSHDRLRAPAVRTDRVENVERARIGDDIIMVRNNANGCIDIEEITSDALAVVMTSGKRYDISDKGIMT